MLSTAHVVVGAAAGVTVVNPAVSFLLGLVSHHLMDIVPHWDIGSLYMPKRHVGWKHSEVIAAAIDLLLAVVIMLLIIWRASYSAALMSQLAWGAFGGVFPDLWHHIPGIDKYTRHWPITAAWYRFHDTFHATVPQQYAWFGILTQVVAMGIGWWIISGYLR